MNQQDHITKYQKLKYTWHKSLIQCPIYWTLDPSDSQRLILGFLQSENGSHYIDFDETGMTSTYYVSP